MIAFASKRVSWSSTGCLWILVTSTDPCEDCVHSPDERIDDFTLSDKDRERWNRYRIPQKRNQFLKSRHAIAFVLKQEFGGQHQLVWDSLADGCPVLLDSIGNHVRSVSLSHSENVFAIGLDSTTSRIGVDCEVVDRVPTDAVYRVLEDDIPDWTLNFADSVMHRWKAAMLWTRYEAEWKAMQNGNRMENRDDGCLSSQNAKNCGSLNDPTSPFPLRSPIWMVSSRCSEVLGTLRNRALVRTLELTGPELCLCVASDTLEGDGNFAESFDTRPLTIRV
jgi:hypothetical protein